MTERFSDFSSSDIFSKLSSKNEESLLYSCDEISNHSDNIDWFEDKILWNKLSDELSSIWNNLESEEEKQIFQRILNKYISKLNWKYNYNIIWRRLLSELEVQWLEKSFIQSSLDIWLSAKCDVKDLRSTIWNSWNKFTSTAWDYIESSFNDLDELAKNIREANNKDRLKLIIDTTAQSAYETMEPSKKLKFLWLFLPKSFINFIENSASEFIVKWKKINTDTFIDDIIWYIENFEWIIDFFEIDTKKYARLDVKNLDFEIHT